MPRHFATTFVIAALLVGVTSSGASAATEVDAKARVTVTIATATQRFSFGQSEIVASTLDGTPQVPVSLHAAAKSDPFTEFVLSGQVKKGSQKTSEQLVLALNVEIGTSSMLLSSDDGDCTVKVKTLTDSRIAGSFSCDTTYGGDDVSASGTFRAK
jgi:hypothetical protein